MEITQKITLDLRRKSYFRNVEAKQGDRGTRFVEVTLTDNGASYTVPEGVSAVFRCVKPDGNGVMNPAVIQSDGTILAELTGQVLAVPGAVMADISLTNEAGEILSSASFVILVEPVPMGAQADSSSEFLILLQIIEEGKALLEECETAMSAPVYDLGDMGMLAVKLDGEYHHLSGDMTKLCSDLDHGIVKFIVPVDLGSANVDLFCIMVGMQLSGQYVCTHISDITGNVFLVTIVATSDSVSARVSPFIVESGLPEVSEADNNKILQVVNGEWIAVAVTDSEVAVYVDDYINSALEGDY